VRLERFRQHAVAAHRTRSLLVDRLERAREEQHRDVGQVRRVLHERRHLVPVPLGHADVGEHDVGPVGFDALDGLLPVADGNDLDVFVRERQLDHALNRDAVVGEQELVRHELSYLGTCGLATRSSLPDSVATGSREVKRTQGVIGVWMRAD
jgi:hypothetical protein